MNLRSENNLLALGIASKLVVVLHLQLSGNDPLPWSTRVQIALDAARGLEYIHEHTVPVYVHRDIKSANIDRQKLACKGCENACPGVVLVIFSMSFKLRWILYRLQILD